MYVGHSQFLQVVDSCLLSFFACCTGFGQGKIFSPVFDTGQAVNREVSVMHLINNDIVKSFQSWPYILAPSFRVCCVKVQYGSSFPVYSDGFSHDSRCFVQPYSVYFYLECIEFPFQIFSYRSFPCAVSGFFHADSLDGISGQSVCIEFYIYFFGGRSPKHEVCSRFRVGHFVPRLGKGRIIFKRFVFFGGCSAPEEGGCQQGK